MQIIRRLKIILKSVDLFIAFSLKIMLRGEHRSEK